MNESPPLLKQTLRATAFMLIPVAAFLAILSAVALFAVPSSSPPSAKEERVTPMGDVKDKDKGSTPDQPTAPAAAGGGRIPGSRASFKPNKI